MLFKSPFALCVLFAISVVQIPAASASRTIPVIFDTDIGTDIDDTWALAQLLHSPELDVKLVLTASGDTLYRARVAAKFLATTGRADVPLGIGVSAPGVPGSYNQEPWVKEYNLKDYPGAVSEDGVGRMIQIIKSSPTPVTIIAVAPSYNLAAALARAPDIAPLCRLVGMFGSFAIGYNGAAPASAETNVRKSPVSARAVFAAPWKDVLLTPLDTCGSITLDGERYRKIWSNIGDPTARAVIENYCIFAPRVAWMNCDFLALRTTVLFDCAAVYLAYDESAMEIRPVSFRVTDDGLTLADPAGPFHARVAMRWRNKEKFLEQLAQRIPAAVAGGIKAISSP